MSKGLFENMSDELRNLSREMAAMEEFKGNVKDVEEVIENINSPLTIMVMGEFSTGKSTFINALMGEAITKVDAKPTTAVITKLVYGERDRIVVHYQDGSQQECSREEFARMTAEADAEANDMHERMDYVERTLPIDMLKSMSIIDSPGLNSIKSVHEDMTRHFMDKADTVLWMFDANKPGSQTEIDALKRLNPRLTPLVLVNKIDGIDEEEGDSVEGILEGVERRLENNKIEAQGYIGISAKMAFKGKTENRDNLVQASNIGAFYEAIDEKVLPGREDYKRNSLLDGLVKMIYGVGSQIKELREKNEERKSSDYAAYVAMETELATVWDELENIADIMLTDIENNQPEGRKRLNAAMKSFYGMLHWLGIFVEQDDEVARKYLEEAAVRGDEEAQRVLVDWLWSKGEEEAAEYWIEQIGIGNLPKLMFQYLDKAKAYDKKKEYDKAVKYYRHAADSGNADAMYSLGEIYSEEEYNGVDYDESLRWYRKSAEAGNADAIAAIGAAYHMGQGVEQDYKEAMKWYKNADNLGSAIGTMGIGSLYLTGQGVEKDFREAFRYIIKSAKAGLPVAMSCMGMMYKEGMGIPQDYDEAIRWYKKALRNGCEDVKAEIRELEVIVKNGGYDTQRIIEEGNLLYNQGKYIEAIECFKQAAEYGRADAFFMLGKMYEDGNGVSRDYNKAFDYYISAANKGDAVAMNNLGVMYYEGRGRAVSFKSARNWFEKSIKAGNDGAKENLKTVENYLYIRNQKRKEKYREHKSSGCFITTAVCDSFGKEDDCYELTVFRNFRDNWLSCQLDGLSLIEEYYDVAPAIVKNIDSLSNAKEIYMDIWNVYLSKCLNFIEQGDNLRCKELYIDMVGNLQKKYM